MRLPRLKGRDITAPVNSRIVTGRRNMTGQHRSGAPIPLPKTRKNFP